jgi:hypothetical protein
VDPGPQTSGIECCVILLEGSGDVLKLGKWSSLSLGSFLEHESIKKNMLCGDHSFNSSLIDWDIPSKKLFNILQK